MANTTERAIPCGGLLATRRRMQRAVQTDKNHPQSASATGIQKPVTRSHIADYKKPSVNAIQCKIPYDPHSTHIHTASLPNSLRTRAKPPRNRRLATISTMYGRCGWRVGGSIGEGSKRSFRASSLFPDVHELGFAVLKPAKAFV